MIKYSAVALVILLCGFADSGNVHAQQTIQLPSFQFFGTRTTIVVPVGGEAFLGSIKRFSEGSASRGVPFLGAVPGAGRLFQNRAAGRSSSSSTASVRVQIYDLRAMDEALLREAREGKTVAVPMLPARAVATNQILKEMCC